MHEDSEMAQIEYDGTPWDGKSRGTKNMIETASELNLHTYVYRI